MAKMRFEVFRLICGFFSLSSPTQTRKIFKTFLKALFHMAKIEVEFFGLFAYFFLPSPTQQLFFLKKYHFCLVLYKKKECGLNRLILLVFLFPSTYADINF